jgi:hypothetical protein
MFRPFSPPSDIKKYGVSRAVQRVGLEQSAHDKQPYTQELQGFSGLGNGEPAITTAKDIFNVLVSAGSTYLETEKQKAEAEKLQAQAAATQAATGLKTASMGTVTPWVIGVLILGTVMTLGGQKKR